MNGSGGKAVLGSVWVFLLLMLSPPSKLEAQTAAPARNVVYAEVLGNALYGGSVNYERMLTPRFSARVGASPFGAFPAMLNYLSGRGDHSAELGLGVLADASADDFLGTATLGYRYQPQTGGLVVRGGWTPLVGAEGVATWLGFSVGVAF